MSEVRFSNLSQVWNTHRPKQERKGICTKPRIYYIHVGSIETNANNKHSRDVLPSRHRYLVPFGGQLLKRAILSIRSKRLSIYQGPYYKQIIQESFDEQMAAKIQKGKEILIIFNSS